MGERQYGSDIGDSPSREPGPKTRYIESDHQESGDIKGRIGWCVIRAYSARIASLARAPFARLKGLFAMSKTLILGGARSGKSRYALELGESLSEDRVFVATAQGFDEGMRERISRHRSDRNVSWRTVEELVEVWDVIERECQAGRVIVLDCLTLWLNNLMLEGRDVESDLDRLVACLESVKGDLILVSNEIGLGLVPDTELGREFRDLHGRMNQRVAAVCDRVLFMVSGLPVVVKGELP